jgi:transcriptional regulator with XRE-family HTH domain
VHSAKQSVEPQSDLFEAEVGPRLKAIRERFGLSQRELARRAGVTNGTVSQIEQGQVSPSIASMKKLVAALSLSLADFFTLDLERIRTPFHAASELVEIGSGALSLRLVAGRVPNRHLQVLHERYAPGADTGSELLSHPGEESGVVVRGNIKLSVGNEERTLGPGDAFYFDSRIPHRFRNEGEVECEIVSASTPPSF